MPLGNLVGRNYMHSCYGKKMEACPLGWISDKNNGRDTQSPHSITGVPSSAGLLKAA